MTSWRAHYAAALYATGVPPALIALALGDFVTPVSHQRVYQLLEKAGLTYRRRDLRAGDDEIDAAVRAAQAAGLVRRAEIIARVRGALGEGRCADYRIHGRITALSGAAPKAAYIPPPGTPPGYRWCHQCGAFGPPSDRGGFCREHYNAHMREVQARRRRARGAPEVGSRAEIQARARAAVAAYRAGKQPSISAACRVYRISRAAFRRIAVQEPA